MTERITITNKPLSQGDHVDVTYDFDGLSITQVTLKLSFEDSEGVETIRYLTLTTDDNQGSKVIPGDATSIVITDPDGGSEAASATIQ